MSAVELEELVTGTDSPGAGGKLMLDGYHCYIMSPLAFGRMGIEERAPPTYHVMSQDVPALSSSYHSNRRK